MRLRTETEWLVGNRKLAGCEAMGDGRERARIYKLATDSYGRESWVFAGPVVRRVCESWGEAIERWEASQ
jgi:hypothetical protein